MGRSCFFTRFSWFILLFFFFFAPAAVQGETYSEKYGRFAGQPTDKQWTVKFNEDLLADSVAGNIYVTTDSQGRHRLNNEIAIYDKSVVVLPPAGGYIPGQTYYLFVDNGVQNTEMENIKTRLKTPFTIRTEADSAYEVRAASIQEKWAALKPAYSGSPYKTKPVVTAPYSSGSLHNAYLADAVNMTNFIRYLAYLPDDVVLNDEFSQDAQAASVLMGANNELSHYPAKPSDLDQSFYERGYLGASTSNIGAGYGSVISSIRGGYMSDADASNMDRVGHRRWILSPKLKEVGFGIAENADGYPYTAMKVIAPNMYVNNEPAYEYVAWPSETAFPSSFFPGEDPWSISLNGDIYDSSRLDEVAVTMTRSRDQKTWRFSDTDRSSGYFNIDTDSYGFLPYTIIFRPNSIEEYFPGDEYIITVSGLYKNSGEEAEITYKTRFFSLIE
ncbi:hypothetical protein BTO30_01510 [Domibacillus antri]|uniref:Uncharacterized protein n=1 Tax=Domibacillus antri TaxID=1714264 RepID=A0A1Q8Q9V4_9BACI|nr:CAP domain-containing protein [Domibacillus antri]OLN24118.1 hypothetical protein BTO30_01510 [Domibacillus antri]